MTRPSRTALHALSDAIAGTAAIAGRQLTSLLEHLAGWPVDSTGHAHPEGYPFRDGDVLVLGPGVVASEDLAVIAWRGEQYLGTSQWDATHRATAGEAHQAEELAQGRMVGDVSAQRDLERDWETEARVTAAARAHARGRERGHADVFRALQPVLQRHTPERLTPDGPIHHCACGPLELGRAWSGHVADVLAEVLQERPTDDREVPYPLGQAHPPVQLAVTGPGTVSCDSHTLRVVYDNADAGGWSEGEGVAIPTDLVEVAQQ